MELPKRFEPAQSEAKWYKHWMEKGYFRSVPDEREPYTVVIPPPNVTGVLHMGHMLNNTIQDVLVRRARMLGKNACWVPGTDHASIATEAKVVRLLAEQGIKKSAIGREEFLKHAFAWKEKYGGVILEQLKKLGASCDWDRTRFTMEPDLSEAVLDVFIDLHTKGLVYRGLRMVNWDPQALTAVSDEEVIYKEVNSKLYHVRYRIDTPLPGRGAGGEGEWITIATTRPETILGDTAVAVHPEDERYAHLKGKRVLVPLINRSIPIIFDEYVEREFGTGALKVTPAHDVNDHELGKKHGLETIDILEPNGTLSAAAQLYIGEDRFVVRKKIAKELEAQGHLVKTEDIINKVGTSERTDAVIEPRLSLQWFVKMKELAGPALEVVLDGRVKLHPQKFVNTYRYWMENVRDWCISRQLWWGQRIPAWYNADGEVAVCKTEAEAIEQFRSAGKSTSGIRQDEDVVDTWFSSWLWPISVFDGFKPRSTAGPENKDIKYYYPTNDLVTAPEILFFWVARMIMAGMEYRKDIPFKNVYLTGIVRDKQGRKMSKSLGNSPDPLELIEKYGADGVRTGMLFSSPAGNDLPFDESLCEQGRNFSNKIWNAFRLVKGFSIAEKQQPGSSEVAVRWMQSRVKSATTEIDGLYDQFRISEALMATYKLIWDDLCSWYLEAIKPAFIDGKADPIDRTTYEATIDIFESVLKLLHPFMPFLTEELWHALRDRKEGDDIIISNWPEKGKGDDAIETEMQHAFELIAAVRNLRNERGMSPKDALELNVQEKVPMRDAIIDLVRKLANVNTGKKGDMTSESVVKFLVGTVEYSIDLGSNIDPEAERKKAEEELNYLRGFLGSVEKKLSNERFVSGAPPQVIENERRKKADAEAKIKALEERLNQLA